MPIYRAVDDPDDPVVAAFRAVRERDLVGRQGCFIAEGEVVLRLLIASPHRIVSLLLDARRQAGLAGLLDTLPAATEVLLAGRAVLDAIVGFPLHRGILALGEAAPRPDAAGLLDRARQHSGAAATVLLLVGIANHDNMGGLFRNAAAFGADAVLLDAGCCDPLYRKAIRVSVGTALTVPWTRLAPRQDPVSLLASHGYEILAFSPTGGARLSDYRRRGPVAVALGSEGPGLPTALIERALGVCIPMAAGIDSLNVATTGALALYHLATDRSPAKGAVASDTSSL